jgi:protein required for attachment to host cells
VPVAPHCHLSLCDKAALTIVAPPQFLGDLRAAMPAQLEACVIQEVNKDLSKLKPAEILKHLKDTV